MNLFYFTMQQLAPIPALLSEGDFQSLHAYLRGWLRRYHPLAEVPELLAGTHLIQELGLDALELAELRNDLENFYGIQILDAEVAALATVYDIELLLRHQLASATY